MVQFEKLTKEDVKILSQNLIADLGYYTAGIETLTRLKEEFSKLPSGEKEFLSRNRLPENTSKEDFDIKIENTRKLVNAMNKFIKEAAEIVKD